MDVDEDVEVEAPAVAAPVPVAAALPGLEVASLVVAVEGSGVVVLELEGSGVEPARQQNIVYYYTGK